MNITISLSAINTLEGLEEEDCVQALEQILAESFGVGGDPRQYWKEQDDGIHVFAVALYRLMKEQHFPQRNEAFPVFLNRMIHSGGLSNGRIEELNRAFFANPG